MRTPVPPRLCLFTRLDPARLPRVPGEPLTRSTREVLEDHLQRSLDGDFETDIERNLSPDAIVLSARGVHHGREGAKELAKLLMQELPGAVFRYGTRVVEGEHAFLEWTARGGGRRVDDGADSFVVRDGLIVAQTIHYTVLPE